MLTESANWALYFSKCVREVGIRLVGKWRWGGICKEETYIKYGDDARKMKSNLLKTWNFRDGTCIGNTRWDPKSNVVMDTPWKISRFQRVAP